MNLIKNCIFIGIFHFADVDLLSLKKHMIRRWMSCLMRWTWWKIIWAAQDFCVEMIWRLQMFVCSQLWFGLILCTMCCSNAPRRSWLNILTFMLTCVRFTRYCQCHSFFSQKLVSAFLLPSSDETAWVFVQIPEVAETCNFTSIMEGYYKTLFPLNPGGIQPVMPSGSDHEVLCRPHNRNSPSLRDKSAAALYISWVIRQLS